MSANDPALLVVDDNENNRFTLTERLKREGYTNVAVAVNGREALERMAETAFDVILLDVMMPEMNGYEVLEHMKSDTTLRHIPVIMISALDEVGSVVKCIQLGAEDYLQKPFNRVLLKARLGACLDKKFLRDQETSYLRRIDAERKRADDILHAVLPHGVVQELKANDTVAPRRYENVAVLFCDVVEFTPYCDSHPPEVVVAHLRELIDVLEEICERQGLEKIKTVGDAFMATAGLMTRVEEPAVAGVRCGLEMAAAGQKLASGWELRVGVHAGPVVAGVIGHSNYTYDLWGDTVNIAARIVDEADPGRVVVTGTTWMQLADMCRGKSHGFVDIKGKGAIELVECHEIIG